jgi:hypothetical protein
MIALGAEPGLARRRAVDPAAAAVHPPIAAIAEEHGAWATLGAVELPAHHARDVVLEAHFAHPLGILCVRCLPLRGARACWVEAEGAAGAGEHWNTPWVLHLSTEDASVEPGRVALLLRRIDSRRRHRLFGYLLRHRVAPQADYLMEVVATNRARVCFFCPCGDAREAKRVRAATEAANAFAVIECVRERVAATNRAVAAVQGCAAAAHCNPRGRWALFAGRCDDADV